MDKIVLALAHDLLGHVESLKPGERYVVNLCGIPGSGKSSLAHDVVGHVNALWAQAHPGAGAGQEVAVVVGMDGWHLTRKQLDAFPDPKLAHDRRGAPFTFDGQAFSDFVASLPHSAGRELWAPGFSHAAKDPVDRGVRVGPQHRVVLVEGLYCTADEAPWRRGAEAAHERWLLRVDRDVARDRLVARHVQTGVAPTPDIARWRAENNDLPNGDWVLQHALRPYREITSTSDAQWAAHAN